MPTKVFICSRLVLLGEGLKSLLGQHDDIEVIGLASDRRRLTLLSQSRPDIVLCDKNLLTDVLEITAESSKYKIIFIEDAERIRLNIESLKDLIEEGVAGILLHDANSSLLYKAVNAVYSGELWIDHKTIQESLTKKEKKSGLNLTKRELEIFMNIKAGYSNKEIAEKLCISEQTVKTHCYHLFKKFGVSSRLKLSLCTPPES